MIGHDQPSTLRMETPEAQQRHAEDWAELFYGSMGVVTSTNGLTNDQVERINTLRDQLVVAKLEVEALGADAMSDGFVDRAISQAADHAKRFSELVLSCVDLGGDDSAISQLEYEAKQCRRALQRAALRCMERGSPHTQTRRFDEFVDRRFANRWIHPTDEFAESGASVAGVPRGDADSLVEPHSEPLAEPAGWCSEFVANAAHTCEAQRPLGASR